MTNQDDLNKLREQGRKAKDETDELLNEDLEALRRLTASDIENLRPQVTDSDTYDKLIDAVHEAAEKNENLAQLKDRVEQLGKGAIVVVKEVLKIL